jgi:hypothetical protein
MPCVKRAHIHVLNYDFGWWEPVSTEMPLGDQQTGIVECPCGHPYPAPSRVRWVERLELEPVSNEFEDHSQMIA